MQISKHNIFIVSFLMIGLGLLGGMFVSNHTQVASANATCTVDTSLLTSLYGAIFHRPLDSGASFHAGKPLSEVLATISNSPEHLAYTGVFNAVKALEEAQRNPNGLSDADKQKYLLMVDSSLSTISAWTGTLSSQALQNRSIGPVQARNAIQEVYYNLNANAQAKAQYGLFNASVRIGEPQYMQMPQ